MYESGSWQIGQFDKTIGERLRLGSRCRPPAARPTARGMPGGAGARRHQDHAASAGSRAPDGISRERDRSLREFYERSLFVPGHLGLAKQGLDYKDASPQAQGGAQGLLATGVSQLSPGRQQAAGLRPQPRDLQRGDQPARPGHRRRRHRSTRPTSASRRISSSRSPSAPRSKAETVPGAVARDISTFARDTMTLSSKTSPATSSDTASQGCAARDELCPETGHAARRLADGRAAAADRRAADALRLPVAQSRFFFGLFVFAAASSSTSSIR